MTPSSDIGDRRRERGRSQTFDPLADLDVHFVSDKSSLSGIRKLIRADLARAGIDPALSFDCLVAVTEACTNALLHGTEHDRTPEIAWRIDSNRACFYVHDFSCSQWHARATHPSRDPDAEAELLRRIGGLGIELMRGLMDRVDLAVGPRGTVVELVKEF